MTHTNEIIKCKLYESMRRNYFEEFNNITEEIEMDYLNNSLKPFKDYKIDFKRDTYIKYHNNFIMLYFELELININDLVDLDVFNDEIYKMYEYDLKQHYEKNYNYMVL